MDVIKTHLENVLGQTKQSVFIIISQGRQLDQNMTVYKRVKSLYSLN